MLAAVGFQTAKDKERAFKRAGAVGKAVIGLALGVQSLKLVLGGGNGQSSSQKQADWTGKLLGAPAGRVLVVLIGLGVIA